MLTKKLVMYIYFNLIKYLKNNKMYQNSAAKSSAFIDSGIRIEGLQG